MDPTFIALSVIILLFSVIVHEVMHGFVALKFGDRTALNAGRLTLNPIPHIDPVGTILLPFILLVLPLLTGIPSGFLIGWAKPVPVNPLNFRDVKQGEILVSLAGIGANFTLAIIAALLYHTLGGAFPFLSPILAFAVTINLSLGVFNLLPIPPLDGSKALIALLPYPQARSFERIAPYGLFIMLGLLYFGVIGLILQLILTPLHALLGIHPL